MLGPCYKPEDSNLVSSADHTSICTSVITSVILLSYFRLLPLVAVQGISTLVFTHRFRLRKPSSMPKFNVTVNECSNIVVGDNANLTIRASNGKICFLLPVNMVWRIFGCTSFHLFQTWDHKYGGLNRANPQSNHSPASAKLAAKFSNS